eukprot:928527-Rhodomonas_salina.1
MRAARRDAESVRRWKDGATRVGALSGQSRQFLISDSRCKSTLWSNPKPPRPLGSPGRGIWGNETCER